MDGRRPMRGCLAAGDPSPHQVAGVGLVDLGARLAACRPPGAARLQQDAVRLLVGVEGGAGLAGCPVNLVDGAGQADGPGAVSGVADLALPAGVGSGIAGSLEQVGKKLPAQQCGRLRLMVAALVGAGWHVGALLQLAVQVGEWTHPPVCHPSGRESRDITVANLRSRPQRRPPDSTA